MGVNISVKWWLSQFQAILDHLWINAALRISKGDVDCVLFLGDFVWILVVDDLGKVIDCLSFNVALWVKDCAATDKVVG